MILRVQPRRLRIRLDTTVVYVTEIFRPLDLSSDLRLATQLDNGRNALLCRSNVVFVEALVLPLQKFPQLIALHSWHSVGTGQFAANALLIATNTEVIEIFKGLKYQD
jgi:hypothetical protein